MKTVNAPHAQTASWTATSLRERISTGRLRPGVKLAEQKLAEELGVSRNTLREAFSLLSNEGVVDRVPNRGVFVAAPGVDGVREIYRVRRLVEPAAVLWGRPDELALEGMRAVVTQAEAARELGDIDAMAAANQELHRLLVGLSESETVATMMERVLARMRLVFFQMADRPDFHSQYVELNAELVERLGRGEYEAAAAALRDYLDRAEAELVEHLLGEDAQLG